jgi:hypothetical protein
MTGRSGTTWHLKARNLMAEGVRVTGSTPSAVVTFTSKLNGVPSISGALAWEPYGFEDMWAARVTLPAGKGELTFVVSASALIDGDSVLGELQQSIRVI